MVQVLEIYHITIKNKSNNQIYKFEICCDSNNFMESFSSHIAKKGLNLEEFNIIQVLTPNTDHIKAYF